MMMSQIILLLNENEKITNFHLDIIKDPFEHNNFFFSTSVLTGQQRLLNPCWFPWWEG